MRLSRQRLMGRTRRTTCCSLALRSPTKHLLQSNLSDTTWTVRLSMVLWVTLSVRCRACAKSSSPHRSMWWPRTRSSACVTSVPASSRLPTRCPWLGDYSNTIASLCTILLPSRFSGRGAATRNVARRLIRSPRRRSLLRSFRMLGVPSQTSRSISITRI